VLRQLADLAEVRVVAAAARAARRRQRARAALGVEREVERELALPAGGVAVRVHLEVGGVRSHCRFRNRGTECVRESGVKWMSRSYTATMRPSPTWRKRLAEGGQSVKCLLPCT
jgi:hypothetical protein